MAKQKGGLGRGLNSLLGGDFDDGASDNVMPVERYVAEAEKERKAGGKKKGKSQGSASGKNGSTAAEDEEAATQDIVEVPISKIFPNPNQPRSNFNREELEELAESIRRNGLLQPILVRKVDDKYEIVAGERRWQACKLLKMERVPVCVRDVPDDETVILALVENIQRSDLNPIEEAYGYRRMMERGNMTQNEIAQAVSKGRSTIANALRLLELPAKAQQMLSEDRITAGHARAILSIPTEEGRNKLTEKLATEKLSVREAEAIARLLSGKKDDKPVERVQTPKLFKSVARSLRDVLDTDVRVKSTKDKNRIEITFKDEADLERLFRIITSEMEPKSMPEFDMGSDQEPELDEYGIEQEDVFGDDVYAYGEDSATQYVTPFE